MYIKKQALDSMRKPYCHPLLNRSFSLLNLSFSSLISLKSPTYSSISARSSAFQFLPIRSRSKWSPIISALVSRWKSNMTSWMIVLRRSCAVEEEVVVVVGTAEPALVFAGWWVSITRECVGGLAAVVADHDESVTDPDAGVVAVAPGRRGEIWRESFLARSRSSCASSSASSSSSLK